MNDKTYYEHGTYNVRIDEWGNEIAKTGTPMLVFKVTPVAITSDGKSRPIAGPYQRMVRMAVTPKTGAVVHRILLAMGCSGTDKKQLESMKGEIVSAICTHKESQGCVYENWDFPLPPHEVKKDPKAARAIDAVLGHRFREGEAARRHQPALDSPGDPPFDDEIPF